MYTTILSSDPWTQGPARLVGHGPVVGLHQCRYTCVGQIGQQLHESLMVMYVSRASARLVGCGAPPVQVHDCGRVGQREQLADQHLQRAPAFKVRV